ncbi:MAG: DUF2974 domain-containing protein [Treponemataceae bacterium]|nr:DUF2974 domain-containing protein [Treponemataceae bacterium]
MKNRTIIPAILFLIALLTVTSCSTVPQTETEEKHNHKDKLKLEQRKYDMDIMDYINWRGDLTFEQDPLNEIDALIFAQISYVQLKGIAPKELNESKTIAQLCKDFEGAPDFEKLKDTGPLINPDTNLLLKAAAKSRRFKDIPICCFVHEVDEEKGIQFAAYTALLTQKHILIAYEGTYVEAVGWREDFSMAYEYPVPAQVRSSEYADYIAQNFEGTITLCGHSKGGNLAAYAIANCNTETKARIDKAYSFDGQGFQKEVIKTGVFKDTEKRIENYNPQDSVIGQLMHKVGNENIIHSYTIKKMWQHDPFTWNVVGKKFVREAKFSNYSLRIHREMNELIDSLEIEERKKLIDGIFDIFDVAGAYTLQDFQEKAPKKAGEILEYLGGMESDTKGNLLKFLKIFI